MFSFARNSKLLILDEATSAMDVNTDTRITSLVHSQFREVTILTVAHRINTITKYDKYKGNYVNYTAGNKCFSGSVSWTKEELWRLASLKISWTIKTQNFSN